MISQNVPYSHLLISIIEVMRNFLIILILVFFPIATFSQGLEVLLIGTSHDYSRSIAQDIVNIQQQILKFKPTVFFGEFVSPQDEENLMDYWCKTDNLKRLERLRANKNIQKPNLRNTIDSLLRILEKNDKNMYARIDLAHAYYLSNDVANGHYQYWQVYEYLKKSPDDKLKSYGDKLLSPDLDISGRSIKRLKTSEYALIAFPIMKELNLNNMLSMDCQDFDLNWSASAVAFDKKFRMYQKDTLAIERNHIPSYLKRRAEGFVKYAAMEKTSNHFTEWLNTDEAAGILSSGDFYFPEMYGLDQFPKEEILSQIHWWQERNREMCFNILTRSAKSNAKRVVVIVGANHRKIMQEIFTAMPNVTVTHMPSSPSKQ